MRRSKLEMYIDILKVLASRGPQKLTEIMFRANINNSVLREYLDFMVAEKLVKEVKTGKKRITYTIAENGVQVLEYIRELKQVVPPAIARNISVEKEESKNGF